MNQYGPYLMYFLSRLMQQRVNGQNMINDSDKEGCGEVERERSNTETYTYADTDAEKNTEKEIILETLFLNDETHARWHRETDVDILVNFCREGFGQAKKHGHFIIGTGKKGNFIGIPGRFYIAEQPAGGKTGFTLWQALAGGEEFCDNPEEMDDELAENIYGYWIARIDSETLEISEV